jgi:hypothetical protein
LLLDLWIELNGFNLVVVQFEQRSNVGALDWAHGNHTPKK